MQSYDHSTKAHTLCLAASLTDGISNSASSGSLRSNTQDCEGILPNKG